jgi:hypothetical protein
MDSVVNPQNQSVLSREKAREQYKLKRSATAKFPFEGPPHSRAKQAKGYGYKKATFVFVATCVLG